MEPLVYREPVAVALYYGTFFVWMLSELRIMVRNRGGTGENLDRGSRVWVVLLIVVGMSAASGLAWLPIGHIPGWWPVVLGTVLGLCGIAVRQWAVATLGAFFTTAVEVQKDHPVIDTGPCALGCWARSGVMTCRQDDLHLGAGAGCARHRHPASMRIDDATHDGQAEPRAR
jgi:protein-S-isoprenylcysteine O-methyltransferase Ste14